MRFIIIIPMKETFVVVLSHFPDQLPLHVLRPPPQLIIFKLEEFYTYHSHVSPRSSPCVSSPDVSLDIIQAAPTASSQDEGGERVYACKCSPWKPTHKQRRHMRKCRLAGWGRVVVGLVIDAAVIQISHH